MSRTTIVLDLSRTASKSADFGQLKETIESALKDHEHTHDIQVTGLQRRVGAEHHVKIMLESEEQARRARTHDQWLQATRFKEARLLGEEWFPTKVDRVYRATLCPDVNWNITEQAAEAVAAENKVQIQRVRWLSIRQSLRVGGDVPA